MKGKTEFVSRKDKKKLKESIIRKYKASYVKFTNIEMRRLCENNRKFFSYRCSRQGIEQNKKFWYDNNEETGWI